MYEFEKVGYQIPKEKDKRIKLTDEQKLEIIDLHSQGKSQRGLAKEFGVSRSLIRFIVDPEAAKRNKQRRKENGHKYYDKDKHRKYIQDHRNYKKELYNKEKEENDKK